MPHPSCLSCLPVIVPAFETLNNLTLRGKVANLVQPCCMDLTKCLVQTLLVSPLTMSPLNARETLQKILAECGYFHWYALEPGTLDPTSCETKCTLFNIKQRKKAELVVPNEWFRDPRRYDAIAQLITLAIEYSSSPPQQYAGGSLLFFLPSRK